MPNNGGVNRLWNERHAKTSCDPGMTELSGIEIRLFEIEYRWLQICILPQGSRMLGVHGVTLRVSCVEPVFSHRLVKASLGEAIVCDESPIRHKPVGPGTQGLRQEYSPRGPRPGGAVQTMSSRERQSPGE